MFIHPLSESDMPARLVIMCIIVAQLRCVCAMRGGDEGLVELDSERQLFTDKQNAHSALRHLLERRLTKTFEEVDHTDQEFVDAKDIDVMSTGEMRVLLGKCCKALPEIDEYGGPPLPVQEFLSPELTQQIKQAEKTECGTGEGESCGRFSTSHHCKRGKKRCNKVCGAARGSHMPCSPSLYKEVKIGQGKEKVKEYEEEFKLAEAKVRTFTIGRVTGSDAYKAAVAAKGGAQERLHEARARLEQYEGLPEDALSMTLALEQMGDFRGPPDNDIKWNAISKTWIHVDS